MSIKSKNSAFSIWFEEQFGKQPGNNKTQSKLAGEMQEAYSAYTKARAILESRILYENRKTAALYAWTAMQKIWDENK